MNTQEQKTPEMWFQMLKEPYRSQAIKGIDKRVRCYRDYPKSLEDALMYCIFWGTTNNFPDVKPTIDNWDVIYLSIQAGETTYLEQVDNTDNLKPEPIDWKAKFEGLKIENDSLKAWYKHLNEKFDDFRKKYDELLSQQNNQGEKVYFYFDYLDNLIKTTDFEFALHESSEDSPIYKGVFMGKKKSVLVNE